MSTTTPPAIEAPVFDSVSTAGVPGAGGPNYSEADGLRRARWSSLAAKLYGRLKGPRWRKLRIKLMIKLMVAEGGRHHSATTRDLMYEHHGISIGAYSYGPFFWEGQWPAGVTIGRFCSIARSATVYVQNHPTDMISMHPFFYEARAGVLDADLEPFTSLTIEDDVWLGANTIVLPSCNRIGRGSIIAAGAVVTKDVEPYTVVAGIPAKPIKKRFDDETIERLLASRWWERPLNELTDMMPRLAKPVDQVAADDPIWSTPQD